MDAEVAAIVAAILHVSRKSGELRTHDAAATGRAIAAACAAWEASDEEQSAVTPDLKESPGWAGYELKIFQLGRALDFVIRKLGIWRGKNEVLDASAAVLAAPKYKRGRQSFAGVLGEHGAGAYGPELAAVLVDESVAGYAIKALTRGEHGGYVAEVRPFLDSAKPWVKNAARAYLAKFAGRRDAGALPSRP